ncbi:MAG: hypothetical protein ACRCUS_10555 [Anaerovoracaceae bacterium]
MIIAQWMFGSNYQNMKDKWGKSGQPWTIAGKVEDAIQSIPNQGVRVFAESLLDEFVDELTECLFEAVYIIQRTYNDDAAVNNLQNGNYWEAPELIVDVRPNVESKEIVRVTAPSIVLLKERVNNTLADAEIIANRDMGLLIGQPAQDFLSTTPLRRQLVFTYRNVNSPPWRDAQGKPAKTVTITVPDVKLGLNWQQLKLLARPFNWGKYRAKADLANGRQMVVFGSSPGEAKSTLMDFHSLCTSEILSLNITEEDYKKNPGLYKQPTQVFVQEATLLVRRDNVGQGQNYSTGQQLTDDVQQIILWTDTQPAGNPTLN